MHNHKWIEVVIPTGATGLQTGQVDLDGLFPLGIQMPSAWTAASITFQGSHDGVTFYDLYDDGGNEHSVSAAASRFIGFEAAAADALRAPLQIKLRSGTTGTPVNQAASRTLYLIVRDQS
jgi:hypothetical protein